MHWNIESPSSLEKTLKKLPLEVGRLFKALVTDFKTEGPFPKGWQIGYLAGPWKGHLKAKLKRDYRVIYRYESKTITIFIKKVSDRKDAY